MGTWDDGLLDNDTAHDGLGDITSGVADDIRALGAKKPGDETTAELVAAVGVLLQLSPFDFSAESPDSTAIVDALKAHASRIAELPPAARKVLDQIVAGQGVALAERPATAPKGLEKALHTDGDSGFGLREAALFESEAGAAYVQKIAKQIVEMVDEDFEDEESWNDLCREAMGMGALGALLFLEPCKVPAKKLDQWRRKAAKGLKVLEAEPDDELEFHRKYYKNLDLVLAALLKRFAG